MLEERTKFKNDINKRAYDFGLNVIRLTDKLPNKRSAWIITDQVIRSAASIGANLTEARASSSRLEYKKFYEISLKSSNETKYWLNLLKDCLETEQLTVNNLIAEVTELSNMLASGVLKLKGKKL